MSDLKVDGFKTSEIITELSSVFESISDEERKQQIKKINGIFQLEVSNAEKQTAIWTIDMKKTGTVYKGPAKPKADVSLILSDEVFAQLAEGKLNGQKAFMTGKLKTKGNMMLATKLDGLLSSAKAKGGKAKL
ncbi:hypothetical protein PILCRDRAFT_818734 [Piloderma croceum F 1598]|uniref:SCP2 domain-containing protein n=1 Tax=Piloderma croceum (strain F 1598) TaxID=765440 RepID=A0A0C3FIZ0_PILCF|nr:hypothetical protein PILCRDRAFT_818734 [Piloderma croceum F 1598]